jgi:hypothetical protein
MAGARRQAQFDPRAIFHALDDLRVTYVLIGGIARVIEGSDEITRGIDITPSMHPQNVRRLGAALESLEVRPVSGGALSIDALDHTLERTPVLELECDYGEIKLVREPEGTRGYDDLRRWARREPIGEGLRIQVAAPGDLVRMMSALGREPDELKIETMRRVVELDRGLSIER